MFQNIELSPVAGSVASPVTGFHGVAATESDHILADIVPLTVLKRVMPWKDIEHFTNDILPKTSTGVWMDSLGVDQFYHRWRGHHLIADGWKALASSDHSLPAFGYELAKDAVTFHGLPLLPDSAVSFLSRTLNVSVHDIMPWVLKNPFDLTIGILAAGEAGYDVFLAFTGQMEWGVRTAFFTFGTGTAEIAIGVGTKNPLLVMAGIGEYTAGVKCAWDYYSQPFMFATPLSELLAGMGVGAAAGLSCSVVTMAFTWSKTTAQQKLLIGARATAVGAVLGFLSAISPWVSIPVGLVWSFSSLAVTLAKQKKLEDVMYRLSSPWALQRCFDDVLRKYGPEKAFSLLSLADHSNAIDKYKEFLDRNEEIIKARTKGSWPERA